MVAAMVQNGCKWKKTHQFEISLAQARVSLLLTSPDQQTPQAAKALIRAFQRLTNARKSRNEHRDREGVARDSLAKLHDNIAAQEAVLGELENETADAQEIVDTLREEYVALRDVCHDPPGPGEQDSDSSDDVEESLEENVVLEDDRPAAERRVE
ncbi:hypothetical protein BD410DRAFT_809763 [Rickenella mellea]|uniref:Uncharacterized protein n=1 Tax=Rickenella mellea TaxID=50990 RepID=A0A4Y7PHA9_9AGAM|nr:hypothetical protein BD410DRAFT_809763 [Rickenella mellea]